MSPFPLKINSVLDTAPNIEIQFWFDFRSVDHFQMMKAIQIVYAGIFHNIYANRPPGLTSKYTVEEAESLEVSIHLSASFLASNSAYLSVGLNRI